MIHVDRSRVAVPSFFHSKDHEVLTAQVASHFDLPMASRRQRRAPAYLTSKGMKSVKLALYELFCGKCAYCEQPVEPGAAEIENFRPKVLYPWLTYDWNNLLLSCPVCNRNKGGRFPLADDLIRVSEPGADIGREHALLIDPTTVDPEAHFTYDSGRIVPRDPTDIIASTTIATLGLNRDALVRSRQSAIQRLKKANAKIWAAELALDQAFLGTKRDFLRRGHPDLLASLGLREVEAWSRTGPAPHPTPTEVSTARVTRVEIHNVKAIDDLDYSPVTRPSTPPEELLLDSDGISALTGWTTLLGENGSGKSSILQAIALALAGSEVGDAEWLVGRRFLKRGKRKGHVRLTMSDGETLSMELERKRGAPREVAVRFHRTHDAPRPFVRAYGATRLLPATALDLDRASKPDRVRIANLFDPFEPLLDAERWLTGLDEDAFGTASLTLKDLLGLDPHQLISLDDGELLVDGEPLETMSAGYQTLVALACDLMAGVPGGLHDMHGASGIVILDEIGAHLHPSWKMRIVSRLRKAFPLLQFFVSTHEPLCLRSHSQGEVALVRRETTVSSNGKRTRVVSLDTDLPSPAKLRVDQLLTSVHFGMASTIDPVVDAKFKTYYALLATPEIERTPGDEAQIRRLKTELQQYGVLGYTRRDQLLYEAIDQFVADHPTSTLAERASDPPDLVERKKKVYRRLEALWRYAGVAEGT